MDIRDLCRGDPSRISSFKNLVESGGIRVRSCTSAMHMQKMRTIIHKIAKHERGALNMLGRASLHRKNAGFLPLGK